MLLATWGVQYTNRKAKRLPVLRRRLKVAHGRLLKARRLVRSTRAAKKLVRGSPYAVAFWGIETTGISPSRLSTFRTQVAAASGVNATSRCATAAIRLAFKVDPAVELLRRLLDAFVRWVIDPVHQRARLRVAWRLAWSFVVTHEGVPLFRNVSGPMSALVASLASIGWQHRTLEVWTSPRGVVRAVCADNFAALKAEILFDVESVLWVNASTHWLGKGLDLSPPHSESFKGAATLWSRGEHKEAGLLECILAGGVWDPTRVADAFFLEDAPCTKCGYPKCDSYHMCWGCPLLKEEESGSAVAATQYLVPKAATRQLDCLYMRGLLPSFLVKVAPPPQVVPVWGVWGCPCLLALWVVFLGWVWG